MGRSGSLDERRTHMTSLDINGKRYDVDLPDDTPLKPGMSVEANIITREKADALLVPADAVQGNMVYVVNDDRVHKREVEVGIRGTRNVEILSGIDAGTRVVSPIPASHELTDGERVRAVMRGAPS